MQVVYKKKPLRMKWLMFFVGDTGFEPVTLPIVNRDALNFFQ